MWMRLKPLNYVAGYCLHNDLSESVIFNWKETENGIRAKVAIRLHRWVRGW